MGDYGPAVSSTKAQVTGNPPIPSTEPDEISVLVTGFGPFKTNLVNASYLIASSLPPSLSFSSDSPESPVPVSRRVSIHVHPAPIPVAYSTVRTSIPAILDDFAKSHEGRRPDIVIHMGIAATRNYYSVETQAHRDSYHMSDIKGRAGYEDGEKLWRELDLPPVLRAGRSPTSISTLTTGDPSQVLRPTVTPYPPNDKLLEAWKSSLTSEADVRISDDAGRYLCEFIYYTSLALAFQQGQNRNVVFFHVPAATTDEAIQKGKNAATALIKALVTCWVTENA